MSKLIVKNPATETVVRELEQDSPTSIASKVQAARAAQPRWAQTPLTERLAVIQRWRDLLAKHKTRLAETLTSEMGKPIRQANNEINGMAGRIDFFLSSTEKELQDEVVLKEDTKLEERIRWEPLGVVANISAWNYPYFVGSNVFVPALLTGNAVIYKPSELSVLTGLEIAALLYEAGVPKDAFQVVVGGGAAGATLIEQPGIGGVFFTGSYATGKRIAEAAASKLVKIQLELGGKDPTYVCDDVDPKAAAEGLADGAFYNTGQGCCSVERIYVNERVMAPFMEHFMNTVRGFKMGDPRDENTYIGALAREPQLGVLADQVDDAVKKGAKLLCGGKRASGKGYFFEPTVLANVDSTMKVMREESFGPIIGIQGVRDDNEAVRQMNDTEYGLTAGVYSKDRARAERILAQVDAGTAYWNCCDRISPRLPWTGRRHSGIGSTLSHVGIKAFLTPKAYHLRGA